MSIPDKILSRKDEITAGFFKLADEHMHNLLTGQAEHRYSATDFAKLLFIHPRHLTNTIKLTTGRSPCDFMEERILKEAQRMLKETNLSVAAIGYKFAYNDPTNFTKFFKGMAGITPREYRKRIVNVD